MTSKHSFFRFAAAVSALAIIPLAGCGGGTSGTDTVGPVTQAADPYIYAYGDNVLPTEASAFGTNAAAATADTGAVPFSDANPASTDTLYFTFASASSAPDATQSGAGTFALGIAPGSGGSFAEGSYVPAVPAGATNVFFRAQAVQGQTANRTVPDITAASISVSGGAATAFTLPSTYNEPTAAGPFAGSPYFTVTSFAGAPTSGIYSATTSITDSAKNTTTTTFQTVALAGTDGAIASSTGTLAFTDGTVPTTTYGPDASGTSVVIVPAGTYAITADGYASTATVTAGEVYIAPTAAPAAASLRHRAHSHRIAHK